MGESYELVSRPATLEETARIRGLDLAEVLKVDTAIRWALLGDWSGVDALKKDAGGDAREEEG